VRAAGGTLLGEHPPGARPFASNFLPRNRLIVCSLRVSSGQRRGRIAFVLLNAHEEAWQ
jgi:hypothetical protein